MKQYSLKVLELRTETADTVTVVFKQPGLKKINYKAGQYLTLIFRINGRRYIRPYSFSSAPQIDANLEVTVKRVPGGMISNHIADQLKVDNIVEVMEPLGDFVLPAQLSPETHIVLWGAGSGITPLMSIAKFALGVHPGVHVTLVYGNRDAENVIFGGQIAQLQNQCSQFKAWHFHTRSVVNKSSPYIIQGRIAPSKVLSVMQQEGKIDKTIHYICGPVGLKESVKSALTDMGVSDENIFTEDFEVTRNPADFEGIVTRNVFIVKDGERRELEVVKGKSILEAGLDAMLELNYSCQTGNCIVCKGKLHQGQVKMIGVEKRPEGLGEDECLLCSSFPLTDSVEITVE